MECREVSVGDGQMRRACPQLRHVPGLGERHIRLAVKDAGANDRLLAITAEVLEILLLA